MGPEAAAQKRAKHLWCHRPDHALKMLGPAAGIEPATLCLLGSRSTEFSYAGLVPRPGVEPGAGRLRGPARDPSREAQCWSGEVDSHHRSAAYQTAALASELPPDGCVAGYRSQVSGLMRPRRRLGSTHF